ncbi:glutaredoxin family protein [Thalassomonas actiniarum]|uniref:Glutaredoxin family protein n=1 Tax=Thalassomonas actiniarum TaxID=485447 RepID=A0AAF0C568_9GAMM|nr:glutaredoxin domain-containing protein [Thalassomonas actiniarum]WDE00781.1 glutaredoxin family protein [Thalassomonas actiniarum]
MSKIEIYTRPGCGYCTHAKRLLAGQGLSFVEYDVYQHPQYLARMQLRTPGNTYPQILINDVAIGGFSELLAMQESKLLPGC